MVESSEKGLILIRKEGKCPEKLIADYQSIMGQNTELICGRSTAKDKVDIDFGKDSGVSRIHAEFYWDEKHENFLLKQIGSTILGFVIDH